jgi:hypothetical protein
MDLRMADLRRRYAGIWNAIDEHADIQVANLRSPVSATSTSFRCPKCNDVATLVIVSAPLLLLIWRLMAIYMRAITLWNEDSGRTRIAFSEPTAAALADLRATVRDYLTDSLVLPLKFEDELKKVQNVPEFAKDTLYRAIDIGQLWVLAHEVAHAIFSNGSAKRSDHFKVIHKSIVEAVSTHDLSPMTEDHWVEELTADLVGLALLFEAEVARFPPALLTGAPETVCGYLAAGVAAACEAMNQITLASSHRSDETHPPLDLRFEYAAQFMRQLPGVFWGASIFGYAQVLAKLSALHTGSPQDPQLQLPAWARWMTKAWQAPAGQK